MVDATSYYEYVVLFRPKAEVVLPRHTSTPSTELHVHVDTIRWNSNRRYEFVQSVGKRLHSLLPPLSELGLTQSSFSRIHFLWTLVDFSCGAISL